MNWKASDYIFYLIRVILISAPASESHQGVNEK